MQRERERAVYTDYCSLHRQSLHSLQTNTVYANKERNTPHSILQLSNVMPAMPVMPWRKKPGRHCQEGCWLHTVCFSRVEMASMVDSVARLLGSVRAGGHHVEHMNWGDLWASMVTRSDMSGLR